MTELADATRNGAAETMNPPAQAGKRKRSPSESPQSRPSPAVHAATAQPNHVQINYLARHYAEDLPLITGDDSLPAILSLITDYESVLQRNESMAANLGAKPKGQALLTRFERMFDGPVKVIQSNAKDPGGPPVTWLDIVEFAKARPADFTLNQVRNGTRLCQIWVKSSKVEVMEDDFDVIKYNPNPIPPQPIQEDEEKELGTLEILDKSLQHVIQLADAVSGRARQLNHRLRARKSAMTGKRTGRGTPSVETTRRPNGVNGTSSNGGAKEPSNTRDAGRASESPQSGFVAVNSRQPNGDEQGPEVGDNGTSKPLNGVSAETHADLLRRFTTTKQRNSLSRAATERANDSPRPASTTNNNNTPRGGSKGRKEGSDANEIVRVGPPSTPSGGGGANHSKPSPAAVADDGGPFKARMVARMERLSRGDQIDPPCDRCRRLRIECEKNLTACKGCTRKHAKCSWKDVREDEIVSSPEGSEAGDEVPGDHGVEGGEDSDGTQVRAQRRKETEHEEERGDKRSTSAATSSNKTVGEHPHDERGSTYHVVDLEST
ncbi:MAG: hypothetical protein M4579_002171 [Chaenotheca gracillima]|nr:MAG: hypothetical protein M4579_002171 [Chaenotheca gracillima]